MIPLDWSSDGACQEMLREKGLMPVTCGAGVDSGSVAPVRPDTQALAAFPALFSASTCHKV